MTDLQQTLHPPAIDSTPTANPLGQSPQLYKEVPLSGVEKAAIIFLCLQEDRGSELMRALDDNEIHQISKAMATIGTVPGPTVEIVIREFSDQFNGAAGVTGSWDAAQRLLATFLPEGKVAEIMADIRQPDNGRTTWESFNNLTDQVIVNHLQIEHDQVIAAILSKVRPEVSARILPLFGDDRMIDITNRMIKLDSLPAHILDELERYVEEDILIAAKRKTGADPHQRMADMFNRMDGDVFDRVQEELEIRSPNELELIKAKMFTFDDLVKLDAQSLSRILRNCEMNTVPLALRGAKKPVRDAILNSMAKRAQETTEEQIRNLGQIRARDARDAQAAIIEIAYSLAQQNVIRLPREDDVMI